MQNVLLPCIFSLSSKVAWPSALAILVLACEIVWERVLLCQKCSQMLLLLPSPAAHRENFPNVLQSTSLALVRRGLLIICAVFFVLYLPILACRLILPFLYIRFPLRLCLDWDAFFLIFRMLSFAYWPSG